VPPGGAEGGTIAAGWLAGATAWLGIGLGFGRDVGVAFTAGPGVPGAAGRACTVGGWASTIAGQATGPV